MYSANPYMTWQLFSTLTKVLDRHSIKVGTDMRLMQWSLIDVGNSAGSFTFDTGSAWVTAGTGAAAPPFGAGLAAFGLVCRTVETSI